MQASTGGPVEPESDAQTHGDLRRWLYRFDCPDALSLGDYQLDVLEASAKVRVAGHATGCDACQSELQAMRPYLAEPIAVRHSPSERVRRVVASLFTPAPGLGYGGVRGDGESATRVLETQDVTITVAPGPRTGSLIGLVVTAAGPPEGAPDAAARLVAGDGSAVSSILDDLGHFEIDLTNSIVVVENVRVE